MIEVDASVDKAVITIGDRIAYSLIIRHDADLHVEQPGPGANLGQFEIKDYSIIDPVELDGRIVQQFDYQISVFDTGRFVIPPFPVAFASSDTARDYQIIQTDPIEITVESVLTAEDNEIRDIKPPQNVPLDYTGWLIIGGIGLIVFAIAMGAFYYWRYRRRGEPLFRKETIRPAHEIALEELFVLSQEWPQMLENGEHKILFSRLSEILRRYLENRFFIKAMEETTFEIAVSLEELELDENDQSCLISVLEFSDLVKFAKYVPHQNEVVKQLEEAQNFIDATKLVFEAVEHKIEVREDEQESGLMQAVVQHNNTNSNTPLKQKTDIK